jgi:RimJ/RimL family protein N-acetyltransferase
MTHNFPALALYHKMSFRIDGTAPYALCLAGRYIDLYYMSKLLACQCTTLT